MYWHQGLYRLCKLHRQEGSQWVNDTAAASLRNARESGRVHACREARKTSPLCRVRTNSFACN